MPGPGFPTRDGRPPRCKGDGDPSRPRTRFYPTARPFPGRRPGRAKRCKGDTTPMLASIINLVSGCVTFLGGFLVVWGAVSLGLAIREQQGGAQIASAISTIAGGGIIIAAAVYFGMLDTSWLPA